MKFKDLLPSFLKPKKRGVTRDEVVAVTKKLGLHHGEPYAPPSTRCPRWLILRWPDEATGYACTLMVESSSIVEWAKGHAKGVYSSNNTEQGAREYLPQWLEQADTTDEVPAVPDRWMLKVLQAYEENFISRNSVRLHCVQCCSEHNSVNSSYDSTIVNGEKMWESVWRCPAGHQVAYSLEEPVRFF